MTRCAPVRGLRWGSAAALVAGLLACGAGNDSAPAANGPPVDAAALCISSTCGTKTKLLDIPSAENTLFAPDGRLFVSGGQNVYEVTRDAAGWHATPQSATACNFTGLALRGNVLYANCFDGQLYATRIDVSPPAMVAIHDMGLGAPNGLVAGPSGELYVVNGPLASSALPDPKIVRLKFGSDPMMVTEQVDWLTSGLSYPNGIQRTGALLLISDSSAVTPQPGEIRGVPISTDGSPGPVVDLVALSSLPDDFSLVGGSFLVALYATNQLALVGPGGSITSTPGDFDNPSSAKLGLPPLFAPGEVVVTEKGVIGLPPTPGYGSGLSVFRRNP